MGSKGMAARAAQLGDRAPSAEAASWRGRGPRTWGQVARARPPPSGSSRLGSRVGGPLSTRRTEYPARRAISYPLSSASLAWPPPVVNSHFSPLPPPLNCI